MPNLIKKSWTVSNRNGPFKDRSYYAFLMPCPSVDPNLSLAGSKNFGYCPHGSKRKL